MISSILSQNTLYDNENKDFGSKKKTVSDRNSAYGDKGFNEDPKTGGLIPRRKIGSVRLISSAEIDTLEELAGRHHNL